VSQRQQVICSFFGTAFLIGDSGSPMQLFGDWRNQLRAMHRKAYSSRLVQLA
jgi:hypothetical protein